MNNPLDSYDWQSWAYGLGAAVIGGGANAVAGGVAINLVDPAHFNARTADFYYLVGSLFLANGTMSFFLYLKQTPLPTKVVKTQTSVTATDAKGGVVSMEKTVERSEKGL